MTTQLTGATTWRSRLPTLSAQRVLLREPTPADVDALLDVVSASDACRFGLDDPLHAEAVAEFVERLVRQREAGVSATWAVVDRTAPAVVGLVQLRQLEPSFETAECECTLVPWARGSGMFLEAARLVGSFAFGELGTHRIEARVLLPNGRASAALRKIGGVQEGVLRRAVRRGGEYFDQVLWSVLKEDWGTNWVSTAPRVH
jgi:RimJ/RimL family protein N-acetyltransferase